MIFKPLGNTGVQIPVLCQGITKTGTAAQSTAFKDSERVKVIQEGIDLGLNLIDTAELYGGGHAEELVGKAVTGRRKDVIITTKFNPDHAEKSSLEKTLDASLARLKTDYVDIYQMHWPNPFVPLEETCKALARLVKKGKTKFIGLSNFSKLEIEAATAFTNVASLQIEYNLTKRNAESALLPYCEKKQITVLSYSPFDSGNSFSQWIQNATLKQLAGKYEKTVAQIILNWQCAIPNMCVLVKTSSSAHLAENAGALSFKMTPEDLSIIRDLFKPRIFAIELSKITLPAADNRFKTAEEAAKNKDDLIPSPVAVAKRIESGSKMDPLGVIREGSRFILKDNHLIYWGMVLAYGADARVDIYERTLSESKK